MSNSIALQLKNVSLRYEKSGFQLTNFNFDIHHGDLIGLVGESGSGKSTVGRLLIALINQSELETFGVEHLKGELLSSETGISDVNLLDTSYKNLRRFRKNTQLIFQNHRASLNLNVTVYDTLKEAIIVGYGKQQGNFIDEKIREFSNHIGLMSYNHTESGSIKGRGTILDKKNGQLSGGQMKRVSITKTVCLNPSIIIADEPLTGLDASKRGKVLEFLLGEQESRKETDNPLTLIIISHDIGMISKYCERMIIMYGDLDKKRGSIVEEFIGKGKINYAKIDEYHPYTRELMNAANYFRENANNVLAEDLRCSHSIIEHGCVYNIVCPLKDKKYCESDPELEQYYDDNNHKMACFVRNS